MSYFDEVHKRWQLFAKIMNESKWFQRLNKGDLELCHYKGYLLETYHHTAINPQIQAFCTMYFKGNPRETVGKFLRHATSEMSHDLMAANDLMCLGVSKDSIFESKPQPSTIA